MATRSFGIARRLIARMDLTGRGAVRRFSEGKGKILSEEELAAETVYIHKMEREKMEKLKKKKQMEMEKDKIGASSDKKNKSSGEAHGA
ncbi:hypothetical protein MLD38_038039 [Melastoma candidum]|uniref:Uncharacterized protein n=1 Tax=Melastoma candidum TaxID=119954 RepID=A0ACB9KYA4_9MYRT|nr:hypothetical protein MLD38_038039 [Melastoma candidum]